jgi:NADH-quinone oxidoreductase subunit H
MDKLIDFLSRWPWAFTGHAFLDSFISIFAVCAALINVVAVYAGLSTLVERKIAAWMQVRVGPWRVGPHGMLQWAADALKLMIKEDITPTSTDKLLFKMAPYVVMCGAFACWAALPYAPGWSPAGFNIGILYLLALASSGVIGILMAGWSSGNKWALFGAMRAAAQIVSYEVPVGLTLLGMLLIYGSLDMHEIVRAQQQGFMWGVMEDKYCGLWSWGVNRYFPFSFIAFLVYYIGAMAETNRTPFDIPEAESELVSGYHTEYSGMRFSFFFLAEYANMFVVSAIATTFFLGGWLPPVATESGMLPFGAGALVGFGAGYMRKRSFFEGLIGAMVGGGIGAFVAIFAAPGTALTAFSGHGVPQFIGGIFWFMAKSLSLIFLMMWLRWTLPRYRVDQLMDLCWKKLTPLAFVNLLVFGVMETRHSWLPLITGGFKH